MFRKNKPEPVAQVPVHRVAAIAQRSAPAGYADSGPRGKRAPRSTVFKQATATTPHGENVPVVIKNMSATGVRIEYFKNTQLTGRVLITEPSVPLRFWADVVWDGDGATGLRSAQDDQDEN